MIATITQDYTIVTNSTYSTPSYHPKSELTQEQLENFFQSPVYGLGLPVATAAALREEIPSPANLFRLTSEDITTIKSNLGKAVYNEDGVASRTFKLPVRATNRLTSLTKMVNYLSIVRHDIRWENIRWDYVTTFNDEYKALEDLAEASPGEVPKYKAIHGMVKRIYAIDTYLNSTYGANKCPLRYLTMSDDLRDEDEPARAKRFVTGCHFAEPHDLLAKEIMARALRSSANARADNEKLFDIIQRSIQHSSFASQADHFKETHDGLGLYKLLKTT